MSRTIAHVMATTDDRRNSRGLSLGITPLDREVRVCILQHGAGGVQDVMAIHMLAPEQAREVALRLFEMADEAQRRAAVLNPKEGAS